MTSVPEIDGEQPGRAGDVLSVAIVNDYEVVVRGLATMLSDFPERVQVVELKVGEPVTTPVDVALYDTFSRTLGAQSDVGDVVGHDGVRKVIVYSWSVGPEVVQAALQSGVAGYVSKRVSGAELVEVIERVHRGELLVSDADESDDLEPAGGDWPGRQQGLTARESEIIALITQGFTNEQIAKRMYLSINTIKSYIRSAYRRMGVTRRAEAVRWGAQHGFSLEDGGSSRTA